MNSNEHHALLIKTRAKLAEAVEQTRLAYQFNPGAYTWGAFEASSSALRAFDDYTGHPMTERTPTNETA